MFKQNSSFKLLVVGLGFSLLTACDADTPTEVTTPAPQQPQQVAPPASSTAIFLPGGAGIDFGMEPKLSREGVDRGTPYKLVVYEFNKAVEDVDQAVQNVLLEQGYTRTVVPDEKLALRAIYRKEKKRILFRYAHTFKEGFNEKTTLTMSWAKE